MSLQFNQVSLAAVATVLDEGTHLTRSVSFADGHQKILGCLLAGDGRDYAFELGDSAERIEITQGECDVKIHHKDGEPAQEYYREGQSFVVGSHGRFVISCTGVVQYVRHFEG